MMSIIGCVIYKHDFWLILISALVCGTGSWTTLALFYRATDTTGMQRIAWHILTALAAGTAIWFTHFIAMLSFDPGTPIGFDPILTTVSLAVAILGAVPGFIIAASKINKHIPIVGGALVGGAIATMHYTGMMALRVRGIISWDYIYMAWSIAIAVSFSAVSLWIAVGQSDRPRKYLSAIAFFMGIILLHFTGMTAFRVEPMLIEGEFSNPAALHTLALAVSGVAFIIFCAGIASHLVDNSVRTETYECLIKMAMTDYLTGLPNRASYQRRLDLEIGLAQNIGSKFALIMIDLDRFKEINDSHGHTTGDEVLKVLAFRLKNALRQGEFAKRLGGDEFAVIHRIREPESLGNFLLQLRTALTEVISFNDLEFFPGASIGVAIFPDHAENKIDLINGADSTMYRSKKSLSHEICYFNYDMHESSKSRKLLLNELETALRSGQLYLQYQVQKSIADGTITGYEALLRWNHPQRGNVPPSEFIPLAEESGLINKLGEWVIRSACVDAKSWIIPYKVAVNISPLQFLQGDLAKLIQDALNQSGLCPSRLELELTETAIFKDKELAMNIMRKIKSLGVRIALDDFGTGYSSLDTLRSFPFDKIKLDRSFMDGIESSLQSKAMVRAVLALGKCLEILVLAEGIETEGQLSFLVEEGCDEGQGYLLGRPTAIK